MDSKKYIMLFAAGAAALITAATTVIVAAHYWEMLSGIWLIAIIGLLLPDWVTWWSTYWYAKAEQDQRVKLTTMAVAAAMTLTMILNAGSVLAVWWDNKERAAFSAAQAKERDTSTSNRAKERDSSTSNRANEIQRMKAAGVSQRNIDTFLKSEAERDKAKTLTSERVTAESGEEKEYVAKTPEPIQRYMAFWVYIVPFLVGLIGKFAVVAAIALPGGAEFGQPAPRSEEWPKEIESNGEAKK